MIFGFNSKTSLLDDDSVAWIFDVFDWAMTGFNNRNSENPVALIYPNNEHFPGEENSTEGMAALIFSQVKTYAGIESIHCELQNENGINHSSSVAPNQDNLPEVSDATKLVFTYHSDTLRSPEVLIASFIHQITYFIVTSTQSPPPGGKENFPHAAELLTVFMGFGVIMANTANTKKIRSCGSCSGPAVERESFLSQYDMTYALALYCVLKDIPVKETTFHLKKSLHSFYKKAYKEISSDRFSGSMKLESLKTLYLPRNSTETKGNY